MMEQMLKLCMFLMRAKLTITEAAGGGGGGLFGCVFVFGLFTFALEVRPEWKKNNK